MIGNCPICNLIGIDETDSEWYGKCFACHVEEVADGACDCPAHRNEVDPA